MKRTTGYYLILLSALTGVVAWALLKWAQAMQMIYLQWVAMGALNPGDAPFEVRPFWISVCTALLFLAAAIGVLKERLSAKVGLHVIAIGGVTIGITILWCLTAFTMDVFSMEVGFMR